MYLLYCSTCSTDFHFLFNSANFFVYSNHPNGGDLDVTQERHVSEHLFTKYISTSFSSLFHMMSCLKEDKWLIKFSMA